MSSYAGDQGGCGLAERRRDAAVRLGVMHTYGSECVRSICEAADEGYRMIDTAAIYGNEQTVGTGIRVRRRSGGIVYHRESVGAGRQL